MQIESKRLILRPWTMADTQHYDTMSKDIGYNCFASPGIYLARDAADLQQKVQQRIATFNEHKIGKFPIFRKSDGRFIGTCGADYFTLHSHQELELGYRLLLAAWGQGYATEAADAMRLYLQVELGVDTLYAFALEQNKGSIKVLEKIGFLYREPLLYGGVEYRLYSGSRKTA